MSISTEFFFIVILKFCKLYYRMKERIRYLVC